MNSLIFSFIPPIPSLYFYIMCTLYLVCSFLLFPTAIPVLLLMESLTWQGQETAVLPSGVESVIWNSELLLLRNPQTKREWVAFPCTLYLSLELGLKACDWLPSIGIKGVSHTKCSSFYIVLVYPLVALNSQTSRCLCLPNPGMKGVWQHFLVSCDLVLPLIIRHALFREHI